MNTETSVWLGIAILALVWANLDLWRARRALSHERQDVFVQEHSLVPVPLLPSVNESARSVLRS